jgi:hypothetical protein
MVAPRLRPRRLALALACFAFGCAARSSKPDAPSEHATSADAADDWTAPPEPLEPNEPGETASAPVIATPAGTIAWEHVDLVSAHGPGWLLRQLDPVAHRPRGKFEGWRIGAVFPDAPELCEGGCDLRAGDIILAVEGDALETPTAYSALFERAPQLASLRVLRVRDGVREQVEYRITPRPLPARRDPG